MSLLCLYLFVKAGVARQGDFLTKEHRKTISESTIVFVNNYAFGPEVDHMLKERYVSLSFTIDTIFFSVFIPSLINIVFYNVHKNISETTGTSTCIPGPVVAWIPCLVLNNRKELGYRYMRFIKI